MLKHLLRYTIVSLLFAVASAQLQAQAHVWWEAENPVETNLRNRMDMGTPGHLNAEQQSKLSGGRWLTLGQTKDGGPAWARYQLAVPKSGSYSLYVRKFWKHGPFKWRFGKGEWRSCGRNIALLDSTFLQKHWVANWVALGPVELKRGSHRFEIKSLDNKGCIDCFLLIDGPFSPRGKLRPGQKTGLAKEGWFAWEPEQDPLDASSPIDLSYLNEKVAGGKGFVRRKGDGFVLGDGRSLRFWMVQANLRSMEQAQVDHWARRLAKYGVNLVRLQLSNLFDMHVDGRDADFAAELKRLHYVVASLKQEGIYSYLGHLYWHTSNKLPKGMIPGFEQKRCAVALPFFANEFQDLYRDFAKKLLLPKNPHTGKSLAEEPALAFVEINNESSLLFHTFAPDHFDPAERALVERSFGAWVKRRYGSIDKGLRTWGRSRRHGPDHPREGRLGLYSAGMLGGESWAVQQRNPKRAADQLQWMFESMQSYYARFSAMLRDEIGVGSLLSGSNWKTADDRVLGGLERYSYTTTDVVLRNSYFATSYASKQAQQAFYAVEVGDCFRSLSALKAPSMPSPLATPLISGYPFMITENSWTRPNARRAEWPVLVASYGSMQGVDGWCFFALDTSQWQATMGVWDLNNPTILGQFPAAALMYRRGDVAKPKKAAVVEKVSLKDAFALKGTKIHALSGRDALWVAAIGDREGRGTRAADGVDPRAFFVGPVEQRFHSGASSIETVPLKRYINEKSKTIRSLTGELRWNYGKGLLTIDTPRAKGATGFLAAAGRIELGDLWMESQNEYGSILVVSLDGKPLRSSKSILVQAATEDMPYGFETAKSGGYRRITKLGGYPLNVRRIRASLSLRSGARRAIVLDGNGYESKRKRPLSRRAGRIKFDLPEDSIYTWIK
ncbi:MAG: hypothetical protein CSA62_09475 [Planctomycetota bacterium]|nr:MAG: hypothetical protein CSA62_09475 [Planctomycetota bacterium]